MILYEYPFNERIRSLLRLEYMFDRLSYFAQPGDVRRHQVAVETLFEILDLTERSDVKSGLLQDIDRQRTSLTALRGHPEVEQSALEDMLHELARVAGSLSGQGRMGQALRDNEWLASLRGRLSMPGGATQVDMPSYYAWQMRDEAERSADIQAWTSTLLPLHDGLRIVLQLLRGAGERREAMAPRGCYQQMLGGKLYQLLRVWVDTAENVFPEISANKYMIWIRFSTPDQIGKPQPIPRDVPFHMALCNA